MKISINRSFDLKRIGQMAIMLTYLGLTSGCASLNAQLKCMLSDDCEGRTPASDMPPKISETGSLIDVVPTNAKRMTHQELMEKNGLGERAGSLWATEGQGGYLFAQNNTRLVGDMLTVAMDGQPKQQIETKVKVIKDLLDQFEKERLEQLQLAQGYPVDGQGESGAGGPPAAPPPPKAAAEGDKPGADGDKKSGLFNVASVPTRIVEKLKDGTYKVEGEQPFMIGTREYKVLVQGTVRPEDFNEQGVSAERLINPKFDILGEKKEVL